MTFNKYEWKNLFMSGYGPSKWSERYLLLYLFTRMDKDGRNCYPSQIGIAKATKMSTRTIQRAIQSLKRSGWLQPKTYYLGKHRKRNMYIPRVPNYAKQNPKP